MQENWAIHVLYVYDRVSAPKEVRFSGKITGESAMHSEVDVGSQIVHKYQVISISSCPRLLRIVTVFIFSSLLLT